MADFHSHRPYRASVPERLARNSYFLSPTGCRIWTAHRDRKGYGLFFRNRSIVRAHRVVWEEKNGPIPEGMFVCHTCDVPSCIEISHLWLGTNADNMLDKIKKGRQRVGIGEKQAHAKLTEKQVREIRKDNRSHRVIGIDYGVSKAAIQNVKVGRTWRHVVDEG